VARVLRRGFLRRWVDRRGPGTGETGLALGRLGSVGVRLLRALVELGAGVRPIGTVWLLGSVRAVGHITPVGRLGVRDRRGWIRGSRLRFGQLGVLGPIGRFGVPVGERWRSWCGRPAAQLGLVGVVGVLRGLGPIRAVRVHQRLGTIGALSGFRLLGQLGVLGTVGFVGHPAAGRLGTLRSPRIGLVVELGARLRSLRLARPLDLARPCADADADADERGPHWCRCEEGRPAGAARSEEGRR